MVENQIKGFVRQKVCLIDVENGRCKKVVLRHLNIDKKPNGDVHSINISSDPALEGTEMADRIILEIADSAQRDANDQQSGVQTYAIFAYYSDNPNYVPRKVFRVAAEDEIERDAGPSEPPTEKGLLMQLMRHNEVNSKNSMVGMGYILATLQKENQQLREQNRHHSEQQLDQLMVVQELLNDGHRRKIEEKQSEVMTTMMEGVYEHLKIALPILANRLAGKDVFPPQMDRDLYLFSTFFENLTEKQQAFMRDELSSGQLTIVAELLGLYEERKGKLGGGSSKGDDKKSGKGGDKALQNATAGRLLKLFERRTDLVKGDGVSESSARIDNISSKLRDSLKNLKETLKDDKESPI